MINPTIVPSALSNCEQHPLFSATYFTERESTLGDGHGELLVAFKTESISTSPGSPLMFALVGNSTGSGPGELFGAGDLVATGSAGGTGAAGFTTGQGTTKISMLVCFLN